MSSDDRLRYCARCGWRPEHGAHDDRYRMGTCPGFVSVQNVPAEPFTEQELHNIWWAAAILESDRAEERAARAEHAVVVAAAELVEPLANARLRKAQRASLAAAVRSWRALDAADDAARALFLSIPLEHERAAERRAHAPTTEATAS